jgi:hypothetical protein
VRSRKFDSISGLATSVFQSLPFVFQCDVGKEEGKAEGGERALSVGKDPTICESLLNTRSERTRAMNARARGLI